MAVLKLQSDQVRIFLEHDVSPNIVDKITGDSPLHTLITVYNKDLVESQKILKMMAEF
jgi:hypothetical protein